MGKAPENARLLVSQVILEALKALKMRYPKVSKARRRDLLRTRRKLIAGKADAGAKIRMAVFP